jgi:hypothetical protein
MRRDGGDSEKSLFIGAPKTEVAQARITLFPPPLLHHYPYFVASETVSSFNGKYTTTINIAYSDGKPLFRRLGILQFISKENAKHGFGQICQLDRIRRSSMKSTLRYQSSAIINVIYLKYERLPFLAIISI